ncbi:hypothetical protein TNCV_573461 [Trichonephila clavipes]|nr:hypothetical protein TNCV_573461 [Trichonephila clavipes]
MPNCRLWLRVLPPMRAWLWWPDGGELQIVSRFARSRFSRSVLVRVQDFIEKVMTVAPVECPAVSWMDFLVNEVSSRIPPLITRCDKSIQTDPPKLHFKPIKKTGHYFDGPSSSPYIGWIHPSTWSIIVQPCVFFISYPGSPSKATSCFSLV